MAHNVVLLQLVAALVLLLATAGGSVQASVRLSEGPCGWPV